MKRRPAALRLIPHGDPPGTLLRRLQEDLPRLLPVVVELGDPLSPRPGTQVLDHLLDHAGEDWILALTTLPLVSGTGDRVFGEAVVGGVGAVVSVNALGHGDDARLRHRVVACAVHEVGHLAGLDHCADPACAMYPSRDLADTDRKGPGMCAGCAACVRSGALRRA